MTDAHAFADRIPDRVLAAGEPSRAAYPDATGRVVDDHGVRVFYEVYGTSPDVVCLLPPWALMTSRAWRGQIPYLSRHFRVITIDPRGNGRSDRPQERPAFSRAAHVRDVIAVLDAVGVERAMMVCASSRSAVLLALCVEHPDRVRAAVFITPQLWSEPRNEDIAQLDPQYRRQDYRRFLEWFARWTAPHPHSTRQVEETLRHGLETDAETLIRTSLGFQMYERDEALALAAQIRCPVLVTQNGGAALYPKDTSGPLAQASSGRLHVFEGLGPLVASRWPVAMNLVLREFFESVRAGSAASHAQELVR